MPGQQPGASRFLSAPEGPALKVVQEELQDLVQDLIGRLGRMDVTPTRPVADPGVQLLDTQTLRLSPSRTGRPVLTAYRTTSRLRGRARIRNSSSAPPPRRAPGPPSPSSGDRTGRRTTAANRAFALAHSWDGQLRPSRASMAAAVLEPLDGRPEVSFDLIIEVEEEPAPPIREDLADLCGVGDTGEGRQPGSPSATTTSTNSLAVLTTQVSQGRPGRSERDDCWRARPALRRDWSGWIELATLVADGLHSFYERYPGTRSS